MALIRAISRGEVYLVSLDPTRGHEIRKTRPCAIVSPDEMNHHLQTVIVAPMTTGGRAYPTRVACQFKGKRGRLALDQLRTVGAERLVQRLGMLDQLTLTTALAVLREMFEE